MPQFGVKVPDVRTIARQASADYQRALGRAVSTAVDRAGKEAWYAVQAKIRSVGLGNLSKAVGFTSSLRRKDNSGDPYAVIFAKGGDESLAGGALESYSQGADIRTKDGKEWLAFATSALPRKTGRWRLTPELYNKSGLVTSIGKLIFRPIGPGKALLVIKNVSLSAKDGRAKALGPRGTRTRIPQKEIVAFILIRVTRRAKRFDKDDIVFASSAKVPDYIQDELDRSAG